MKTNSLLLLSDYRGAFASNISSARRNISMDIDALVEAFARLGTITEVKRFAEIDLNDDYRARPIIYTSSEDSELRYKSYIEDIILTLSLKGAFVLPRFEFLRAHHNKSMMEGLRYALIADEARVLDTRIAGTHEELKKIAENLEYPQVIKTAFGAGATGVALAKSKEDLINLSTRMTRSSLSLSEILRERAKRALYSWWQPRSLQRGKIITQKLIPGLSGDFKVLCFGQRFYILSRKNRENDFRASGSGNFSHDLPANVDAVALLDYADSFYRTIDCPILSLDIAYDGNRFWTIEFQCLHFGTLTAESSDFYYDRSANWRKVSEEPNIESVYAAALTDYIKSNPDKRT